MKIEVTEQRLSNGKYFTEIAEIEVFGAEATPTATLSWFASGDDSSIGTATSYEIRFDTSEITAASFGTATLAPDPPVPQPAGSPETFVINSGLSAGTTTWFAIKTSDEAGNSSLTVVSATMPAPE